MKNLIMSAGGLLDLETFHSYSVVEYEHKFFGVISSLNADFTTPITKGYDTPEEASKVLRVILEQASYLIHLVDSNEIIKEFLSEQEISSLEVSN